VVKRLLGMSSIGVIALLAAGCGVGSTTTITTVQDAQPPELSSITVAAVPVADDAGLYVAKDQGLFAEAGLNVTIDPIISSAVATAGMNSGKYAITAGNSVSYVQDQVSRAADLEIVADGSLMRPGNQALYILPSSTIANVSGLRGKRIGVNVLNNIGTLLIDSVLQANGVPLNSVHFVAVPSGFPGMADALQHGQIDAAWLPEPWGSIDEVSAGLTKLTDLDNGANTNFPVAWYVATKAWAKKYPRTLAAFLGALKEGQRMAGTNRVLVEQAMEKLPAPYTVPASIASVMSLEAYPVNVAPDIDLSAVQQVADLMYQVSMLKTQFQVSTMLSR
jgi:NitT/TauT family transport system substrate-binding protein